MEQPQQIDIDELAREKVQEIERSLSSSENHKLVSVDQWFTILKQIITAADLHRTNDANDEHDKTKAIKVETDDSIYADYADDNEQFNAVDLTEQFATNSVKWTIRVKAFKLVHSLVHLLNQPGKFASAKMPLSKYLPDLVRLSFVAATSPYDDLKTQGFEMFKFLIKRFAFIEEREFPGVSILYQYRTQVLSALKPAFNLDAPPYITAIASQVCCLWICQGFEKDEISLKRTFQLMLASIDKLENQSLNQNSKLYTESELEQERLDILGSWAQLYITAKECDDLLLAPMKNSRTSRFESRNLNELVKENINSLIDRWWEALKDYALLIMPASRAVNSLHEHENVYTREVALKLFEPNWSRILLASAIWLCSDDSIEHFKNYERAPPGGNKENCEGDRQVKYFKFICGIIMKELCSCNSDKQIDSLPESSLLVVKSLSILVNNNTVISALVEDVAVAQEFYTIIYSILINRTKPNSQHHLFIRDLLDHIFILVARRVASRPDHIKSSLAYLTDELKADIERVGHTLNVEKSQAVEAMKTNLIIRLSNTVNLMKLIPEEDPPEYEFLVDVFRQVLSNECDYSTGIALLELLKDFYTKASSPISQKFIENLFATKKAVVSKLLSVFGGKESLGRDKLVQCLNYLENYLRSMREDISLCSENDSLVKTYVEVLLQCSPSADVSDNGTTNLSRKKDWLDLCLKNVKDLDMMFHDRFERVMTADIRELYNSTLRLQQEIQSEIDSKRNSAAPKKPTSVAMSKQPAKITLKADFSNFYAKKS